MEKSRFQQVPDDASLEEKISVIKSNYVEADKMRNEISSLKVSSLNTNPLTVLVEPQKVNEGKSNPEDAELSEIFKKIVSLDTMNLTEEEILEELRKIISTSNPRFNFLIERLKILLYKDIVLYSKMYIDADNQELKTEVERLVEDLRNKICLLDDIVLPDDFVMNTPELNLYFLTQDGDAVLADTILKRLHQDSYYKLEMILKDLKKGRLKRFKRLTTIPVMELGCKDFRLFIDQLNGNSFIILDGFIKKAVSSQYYNSIIRNRFKQYQKAKSEYIQKLNDPDFIAMHTEYFENILKLLNNRGESMGGRS